MLLQERYNTLKLKIVKVPKYWFLFILVLLSLSLARNIIRILGAERRITEAKSSVQGLSNENERLKQEVDKIKTEEFVEKQARDRLGLAKEGEIVIVLPDDDLLRKLAPKLEDEENVLPDPNWMKWLKLFI